MTYKPWPLRSIGVELEMTRGSVTGADLSERNLRRVLEAVVTNVNSRAAGYWHSDGSSWDVKTDSSCGWEVASPAMRMDENGEVEDLRRACEALGTLSPIVNGSCGTHEHIDCSDYTWRDLQRLVILWARYEPFFFELMPPARRNNRFCPPMCRREWGVPRTPSWHYIREATQARNEIAFREFMQRGDSRGAFNFGHWWRNGRIEIRLHSGTINYTKLKHWSMLMAALVNRPKLVQMPEIKPFENSNAHLSQRLSTEYICKAIGILPSRYVPDAPPEGAALASWLHTRRLQFTPEAAREGEVLPPPPPPPPVPHRFVEGRSCMANIGYVRGHGLEWEGRTCPNTRRPGLRVCTEHSEDFNNHVPFRDTRPAGAVESVQVDADLVALHGDVASWLPPAPPARRPDSRATMTISAGSAPWMDAARQEGCLSGQVVNRCRARPGWTPTTGNTAPVAYFTSDDVCVCPNTIVFGTVLCADHLTDAIGESEFRPAGMPRPCMARPGTNTEWGTPAEHTCPRPRVPHTRVCRQHRSDEMAYRPFRPVGAATLCRAVFGSLTIGGSSQAGAHCHQIAGPSGLCSSHTHQHSGSEPFTATTPADGVCYFSDPARNMPGLGVRTIGSMP